MKENITYKVIPTINNLVVHVCGMSRSEINNLAEMLDREKNCNVVEVCHVWGLCQSRIVVYVPTMGVDGIKNFINKKYLL